MRVKILVTTSHRPTPTVRRFAKNLALVLPLARYVTRGRLTLEMLALQALDLNAERVLIVRGRKGNPGYIDLYHVNYLSKSLSKLCSMHLCGYIINKMSPKNLYESKYIMMCIETVNAIDEDLAECLLTGFNVTTLSCSPQLLYDSKDAIMVDVKRIIKKEYISSQMYEVSFKNYEGKSLGPVMKICKTKIFIEFR